MGCCSEYFSENFWTTTQFLFRLNAPKVLSSWGLTCAVFVSGFCIDQRKTWSLHYANNLHKSFRNHGCTHRHTQPITKLSNVVNLNCGITCSATKAHYISLRVIETSLFLLHLRDISERKAFHQLVREYDFCCTALWQRKKICLLFANMACLFRDFSRDVS